MEIPKSQDESGLSPEEWTRAIRIMQRPTIRSRRDEIQGFKLTPKEQERGKFFRWLIGKDKMGG